MYPKLRNLAFPYVCDDTRVWAHWNHSFQRYLSYLVPVSCVFTSRVPSGLTVGSGCSLMAAGWQVFFPSWVPSGLTSSPSVVTVITKTVTSFVYWCGKKYSISQLLHWLTILGPEWGLWPARNSDLNPMDDPTCTRKLLMTTEQGLPSTIWEQTSVCQDHSLSF